jgi:hypothetical protein
VKGRAPDADLAVRAAAACAFATIAHQVAGKAVRDALFLSQFPITSFPRLIVGTSLVSIAAVLASSRLLGSVGPARLLPLAFAGSAALQIALAVALPRAPDVVAVALYVHVAVGGAVLISWFWSMLNEALDPSTARRRIGRIAGGGTLGGLVGGLAAERVASTFSMAAMLPLLATLHAAAAVLSFAAARALDADRHAPGGERPERSGLRVMTEVPYLRNLGILVLTGTVAATLLDYVFKERAVRAFAGDDLLRFFGLFYTASALATFLLQSVLTRRMLAGGLARTAATLPAVMTAAGAGLLVLPGLAAAGVARALEAAVRSSLFRSSYELFYGPIRRADKRAAKTMIDVGFDRLGDAMGGGLVQLVLLAGVAATAPTLLGLAIALGIGGLVVARRLHQGYVQALETSLLDHAARPGEVPAPDEAGRSAFLRTVAQMDLGGPLPEIMESGAGSLATEMMSRTTSLRRSAVAGAAAAAPAAAAPDVPLDPTLRLAFELRSGDPSRVRRALLGLDAPLPEIVPTVVQLLAWDAVAPDAVRVLRRCVDRHVGQLVDALLDPAEEFAIRRRIARVLGSCTSPRALDGLVAALSDARFEVRFQAGVALARVHERLPDAPIDRVAVLAAVEREAGVNRQVWESNRLLDDMGREESPFYDEVLRARSSRSLEHVFNVLSLLYPRQPLRIAYRGLHADDRALRGTALEYLEQILPPAIREGLWPFLDDDRGPHDPSRGLEDVMDSLLRSHESIQFHLEMLRRKEE